MIIGIIPAHNEQDQIENSIMGLKSQTIAPDVIIVASDNSTDSTAEIAAKHAAVYKTRNNVHKKAGALNSVIAGIMPSLQDDDVLLIQDADSKLDSHFIESGMLYIEKGYGAVGGVFRGSDDGGFVGHLQRNEYARYARDVSRLNGKCLVVTGTAAMFKVETLRAISNARRAGEIPAGDGDGGIYDTSVLTEDNELSFALLHLGYKIISPETCTLETEVMGSWRELWQQRLRWKRGAVENLFQYGLTKYTWRYWGRQLFTMLGLVVSVAYLTTLAVMAFTGQMHFQLFWLAITGIFVVERAVTVRYRGWRQQLLSATMYELVLDYYLQACHAKAYFDALLRTKKVW